LGFVLAVEPGADDLADLIPDRPDSLALVAAEALQDAEELVALPER
jgi:hypothetical protein